MSVMKSLIYIYWLVSAYSFEDKFAEPPRNKKWKRCGPWGEVNMSLKFFHATESSMNAVATTNSIEAKRFDLE